MEDVRSVGESSTARETPGKGLSEDKGRGQLSAEGCQGLSVSKGQSQDLGSQASAENGGKEGTHSPTPPPQTLSKTHPQNLGEEGGGVSLSDKGAEVKHPQTQACTQNGILDNSGAKLVIEDEPGVKGQPGMPTQDKRLSQLSSGGEEDVLFDVHCSQNRPQTDNGHHTTSHVTELTNGEREQEGEGHTLPPVTEATRKETVCTVGDSDCTGSERKEREGDNGDMKEGKAEEIERLGEDQRVSELERGRDELVAKLAAAKKEEASFQEIAKELESKCFRQQERVEQLELEADRRRKEAEEQEKRLQLQIDQLTKQCQEVTRDKTNVIAKLAKLQEEQRALIDQVTDKEKKVKELGKDNDKLDVLVKKQRAEVLKLQGTLEKSESRCNQLSQDLSKEKEEGKSLSIKLKWAQNKLKAETETHKSTKTQLESSARKLKQAKEEGEQIRADLKQMIQQYQESEDMRSNSLDIKLKKTEKELQQQEQEIADQQELHELTVKELELAKSSHKIAQEEVQHHKQKIAELNSHASKLIAEIEELKTTIARHKQDNRKLSTEMSELQQRTQGFEKEQVKFTQLREVFTQLQKSHQHLEKELEKRKERESELLAFSAKLSTANAELTAERSDWETKVTSLSSKEGDLMSTLTESESTRQRLEEELKTAHESSHAEVCNLMDRLDAKTRAVEELTNALEDERELVKAVKKKNSNIIKDLQKQLQSSNRRIESLEASLAAERESPATLPISRTSSHSSLLDGGTVPPSSSAPPPSSKPYLPSPPRDMQLSVPTASENISASGGAATIPLSDDERVGVSPSPEHHKFSTMDDEKVLLVQKLCQLKQELVKQEEKAEFFEEHITQLTEDIQKKSRIIQSFIVREQSGALAPPSSDENKVRQAKKGGVMGAVFSGKPEVNYELSLEMNKKMQSVLEDTLLKNITLKENIDTLGREIQRISAQLQTYEKSAR